MAGSVLVTEFLSQVSRDLGDINPQFTRWTQVELVSALNDGQRAIAMLLPHSCSRVDAIKLVTGTKQSIELIAAGSVVPGDGSVAVAVRGNVLLSLTRQMGANGLTPGRPLAIVDRDQLDISNPDWHLPARAGKKPIEYCYDPRTPRVFYVNPGVPVGEIVWVEASMLADPIAVPNLGTENYARLSTDPTKLSVADVNKPDLMHYTLARANMKSIESQASVQQASLYSRLFLESINAQITILTGINPNLQTLPFSPQAPATAR